MTTRKPKDSLGRKVEGIGGEDGGDSLTESKQDDGLVEARVVDAEVRHANYADCLLTPGGKLLCFGVVFLLVAGVVSVTAIVLTSVNRSKGQAGQEQAATEGPVSGKPSAPLHRLGEHLLRRLHLCQNHRCPRRHHRDDLPCLQPTDQPGGHRRFQPTHQQGDHHAGFGACYALIISIALINLRCI